MKSNQIAMIPQIELDLVEAYVTNGSETDFLDYFLENKIPQDAMYSPMEIAVARVLLHPIQGSLPQWAGVRDGELVLNRKEIARHRSARHLTLKPELVCCINWADSAPGYSWPEAYHVTYIPGLEKYIVTSSRDGAEPFGSADHALGWGAVAEGPVLVAKRLIQRFWTHHVNEWEQERWVCVFDEGLINSATAAAWADEVWPPEELVEEDEEE